MSKHAEYDTPFTVTLGRSLVNSNAAQKLVSDLPILPKNTVVEINARNLQLVTWSATRSLMQEIFNKKKATKIYINGSHPDFLYFCIISAPPNKILSR